MSFASLKARIDRLPTPSYRLQVGVAIAVVATQALIAMTGAIVRVTGSGLGCPTWPQCHDGSMVPVEHPEFAMLNQWIEFGNRLFTGLVGIIAGAAFVLAYLHRPRDKRYLRLALAMPVGVVVQAAIGGITVRLDLLWWTVAIHLLASTVMVWLATLLVHAVPRGQEPAGRGPRLLYVPTALLVGVLVTGTMVTGAGPHGGDPETPRFDLPVETLAHVHAAMLYTFLGSLVLVGFWLRGTANPPWRRYQVLLAVVVAQGAIGLVQFWTGVPELLVSLHVLGAMCVIVATASLWCGVRVARPLVAKATPTT
ncbi:COX15/CtaA family protein [Actinophytocola gossypii]|uniref:Heme A synthase n=1 Tax=Actinophytocola gossypii TaxID=2812003 RepID=A0ABT2J681_9PSEU|nr:COX15/CtaA family protein [Actinophytocola gossypii]MCT2583293.1 heme A synthase [Actinophytocola gossypii]